MTPQPRRAQNLGPNTRDPGPVGRRLLLVGGLFGGNGLLFALRSGAGFGLFLIGFLLIRFRGSIAHNIDDIRCVDFLAACQFLRREAHYALTSGNCK